MKVKCILCKRCAAEYVIFMLTLIQICKNFHRAIEFVLFFMLFNDSFCGKTIFYTIESFRTGKLPLCIMHRGSFSVEKLSVIVKV